MASRAITGNHKGLIDSLTKAGIIPEHTRRVVIDIPCDGVVMLYYETFADERILDIDFASHLGVVVTDNTDKPSPTLAEELAASLAYNKAAKKDSLAEAMAKVDAEPNGEPLSQI